MAWDLAIDLGTGDLVWTGINDIASRSGDALDKQRIHVRLFIERGEFIYDPTHGALGSRITDALHLPRQRALQEIGLMVREALEPMEDIEITDVGVVEQDDGRSVLLNISYKPRFDSADIFMGDETLQENVMVEVPI